MEAGTVLPVENQGWPGACIGTWRFITSRPHGSFDYTAQRVGEQRPCDPGSTRVASGPLLPQLQEPGRPA